MVLIPTDVKGLLSSSIEKREVVQEVRRHESVCSCDARRFQVVDKTVSFKIGIGDPGTILACTLNLPPISTANQFHLVSLPPPLIHFSRESHPNFSFGTQLAKIGQ